MKSRNNSIKTIVSIDSTKIFFHRGLKIARNADMGKKIFTQKRIISFEDAKDLIKFISDNEMS